MSLLKFGGLNTGSKSTNLFTSNFTSLDTKPKKDTIVGQMEIRDEFYSVGEKGWLDFETDTRSSVRPFVLVFSSNTKNFSSRSGKLLAFQCSGKCFYPLASHLTPTKHAVVQNLIHSRYPEKAPRVCCVPTKLGPISLLYLEAGVPTYNYDYSEMVVLECGCR
ncbi:Bone morphogenetic protein 10 [Armadillidium vulgare]|nr:Bone morphogenetic protein 10 [Armadillidium vulgare]